MRSKRLPLSLGFYFLILPLAFAAGDPQVEFFSPQGTVKTVRQVSVRFSEAMVPLGDPRGFVEPFEAVCSEKGNGRWADGRNWVFDFERDLPAGIRCEFRLKPDVKSLSGKGLVGQRIFSFSTGGPSIRFSIPYEGDQFLDEEQIFILALDAEPDDSSVLQNVTFSVEGIESHAGIRIIEGNERKEILKTRFRYRKPPEFPLLLIQSTQRFPSDTKVSLIWGKGVMSKTGVAGGQDQILRFQTRKPFSAEFHCERENPRADCIPLLPMTLSFTAPISKDEASKIVLRSADGKTWRQKPLEDEEASYISFSGPFPEKTNFTVELPLGLKDDAERPLTNADKFPLAARTDSYPPLAKFAARFGILELKADPQLAVTLRNLEPEVKARVVRIDKGEGLTGKIMGKILNIPVGRGEQVQAWLRRVASASRDQSILAEEKQAKEFKIPKPMGPRAFEVVGMPLKNPGLYVVELESAILGTALLTPPQSMYVPTAVLVTNLSVHFKWGRESSLVWVTTLDKGEPVKDATVTIRDCQENTLWIGKTDAQGLARVEISLPSLDRLPRCDYKTDHYDAPQMGALNSLWSGLFIMASTPDDMSFVHSSWDEGIEPWRFQLPYEYDSDAVVAHTIFDRALFRAGETVHMKHLLRRHTTKGFSVAPSSKVPNRVLVRHYGSEEKFEFPLTWDRSGVAETVWNIPKEAKLGSYEVVLTKALNQKKGAVPGDAAEGQERQPSWTSGRFRVEEFRIPLTKGTLQPPAGPLVKPQEIPFDLSVQYLAGGGAAFLPVKFRHEIKSRSVAPFEGFDEFIFGNGPVKEGLVRRGDSLESEEEEGDSERRGTPPPATDLTLDRYGTVRTTLSNLPEVEEPKELIAELEFRDPNGEIQTVSSKIPLWQARTLVGIKPDSWAMSKETFKFHTAVVDLTGKPMEGVRIKIDLLQRKTYTHRKRLVGGFYAYEHSTEIKKVGSLCEGTTDSKGLLTCDVRSPVSGNVILQADILDDRGNRSVAHQDVWIAGKGEWWFEVGDHDRIDLLPERKRYEPGEKATFQVRMPFREATALLTVEREGVMEAWVQKLSGKNPVLEVPIKGNYAPNVYVSALVVRGRVAGVQPTALVDLGKPAYKLGIAEIQVGWRVHELKVSVSSARKVYRVREKAKVRIRVRTADGKIPPPGSEVAVAAVDEGLLELMPNRSWELLSAMMGRRAYDVRTATAQMQVIGKRHFGLKSYPQGGGGGRQPTREMFEPLLLWKARLPLDLEGEASVDIPLNDSVTSFKIVAVATGGTGLFGTGATSIQSTQNLMILSGLPPLVREGDQFKAGFTLRNTTAGSMDVEFSAKVEGLRNQPKPMVVSLASGEAKEVGWDAMAPIGVNRLQWELEASERGSPEKDRIKISQRVTPVVPVSVFQGTFAQLDKDLTVSVDRPQDAIAGRGGVRVTLRPKLAQGLSGVTDYMAGYPYFCMEQKISVAVALRDENRWKRVMSELPTHLDADGLVKYFSSMTWGSPTLTSYILAIAHEAGWSIPDETKGKMATALRNFVEGSIVRYSPLPTADLSIRKLSAVEALSRYRKAEAKLLSSISIEPNLWPTSAVIDWLNILQNMGDLPSRTDRIKEAEQILRSRLNFQGTTLGFSTEKTDALWWLMISNDVNAVRAVLSLLPLERWKEDLPRIVQGALGRQRNGRWDLTLANAWGMMAMEKFSKGFEAISVSGFTRATLSSQSQVTEWSASPQGKDSHFPWPAKKEDLSLTHQGNGKPWVTLQSLAAIPLKEPLSSGYKIKRTVIPMERKDNNAWSRGDILRVRLEVEAQADQAWVVVSDPVPAGATILGSGLGRDSQLLSQGEERKGMAWLAYEERSSEAYRCYYEYVPKGKWVLEYTLRLNQSGVFQLPTTRVEALYFPEMFGEVPNPTMKIQP